MSVGRAGFFFRTVRRAILMFFPFRKATTESPVTPRHA